VPEILIHEEELGRFLLAYYRGLFFPLKLGVAFLFFHNLHTKSEYEHIRVEKDDNKAVKLIAETFAGRLG
jgi:hypothetical protein